MSEVQKMLVFGEKNEEGKTIPDWVFLDAPESTFIRFKVLPQNCVDAFNVVKRSDLPQEVIDFLTEDGTFVKVLTKAGFGIGHTSGDDAILEGFVFKGVLGEYNEDFLNIIAPYVVPDSYIRIENDKGYKYEWSFDGSHCRRLDI